MRYSSTSKRGIIRILKDSSKTTLQRISGSQNVPNLKITSIEKGVLFGRINQ